MSEIDPLHNSDSERPNICIVGASIAGLRCAAILHENGFNVTILEARSRVGGRVRPPPRLERLLLYVVSGDLTLLC
jgi:NADPH-dependent 2,4-dienoyl-CoA reductase/sulfur reductase-like enzyme